jgi:hypothetical protein
MLQNQTTQQPTPRHSFALWLLFCLMAIARPTVAQVHPAPGDTIRFPLPPKKPNPKPSQPTTAEAGSQSPSDVGPQVIGPSPEAASLGKFAQVPVSLYTGTPTINIPLYDIKSGPLVLPIGLSYHASGIKLDEIPSWVGSGWALNAGGLVTRTVRGKPDDQLTYGFLTYSQGRTVQSILQEPDQSRLITYSEIVEGCADVEPDVFSVNVADITAQFMFDWNGQPIVYRSSRKIKIAYQLANNQISEWTITDDQGTVYTFRDRETTKETTLGALGCKSPRAFTSSWYVSEITDVNGENKILFTYGAYSLYYTWQPSESYRWLIDGNSACGNGGGVYGASSRLSVQGKRIQSITTDNGTVTVSFVPATDLRQDNGRLISFAGYNQDFVPLSQIVVKNYLNEEIRTFKLEQDYAIARLTLRKVYAQNNGQNSAPPHQFDYNTQYGNLPPLAPYMTAQDHWGYYNGQDGNTSLLPSGWVFSPNNLGYTYFDGANREASSQYTKYGVLNRITYPTGGYTDLDYEAHSYGFVGSIPYSFYPRSYYLPGVSTRIGQNGNSPVTTTFTVNPDPNTPNQATAGQVGIIGQGITGATNLTKPYVQLQKSDGTYLINRRLGFGDTNESFQITLLPDTYTLRVGCQGCDPDLQPDDYAYIGVAYYDPATTPSPALAGGVRLKAQYIHEQSGDTPQTFNYQYVMADELSRSSGVIYAQPNYEYLQRTFCEVAGPTLSGEVEARYLVRVAQNTLDLALTQGSHIGYREVQVTQGGGAQDNGKTVYKYTSPYDYPDAVYLQLPFRPAETANYKTGLLTESRAYKYENNAFSLVQQTATQYSFSEVGVLGLRVNFQGGSYSPGTMFKFEEGPYTTNLGFAQPVTTTNTMWYDGSPVVTTQTNTYDTDLQNLKAQTQTASNNNGEQRVTEFYYPQDFSATSLITEMTTRNVLGVPLETITKFRRNGTDQIIGGSYQGYSLLGGNLRLTDVRKLRVPLTADAFSYASSGTVDSRYDTEIEYSQFDGRGNYRQFIRRGGQPTTVLWGYRSQYPIAEIANASFDNVSTALDLQGLTPGSVGNSDDAATLRDRINTLRGSLSGALAKSATYRPLIGIDSQTSSDGRTTYYSYDSFLRLQTVSDNSQNIVKTHTYNYRN